VADGRITWDETRATGVASTFDAFTRMMRGENVGKMVVAV
jgi:hypothetical protein